MNGKKAVDLEAPAAGDQTPDKNNDGVDRRGFLEGAKKFATGSMTAVAIWESLRHNYAFAETIPKDDARIKTDHLNVDSPKGLGKIECYLARPANASGKLPVVLVVHENRGRNPYIEDVTRRLAVANFIALAPDGLTSVGGFPGDDEKGAVAFRQVDGMKMANDFEAAARWLKANAEGTGKVAAVGFCYGGGVVNTLAVRMGADLAAGAPFYGRQPNAEDTAKIKAPKGTRKSLWVGFKPYGMGEQKPNHYGDMAKIVWKNEDTEMAILELKDPIERPALAIAPFKTVEKEQVVYTAQFPDPGESGTVPKISEGKLLGLVKIESSSAQAYKTSASMNKANSGGALFDACGNVIGINMMVKDGAQFAYVVDPLLEGLKGKPETAESIMENPPIGSVPFRFGETE